MKASLLLAFTALTLATACQDDEPTPTPAPMQVSGTLNATNALPTNTSAATGMVTGTYDPSSRVFNYTVTFSGLTGPATMAHFHFGDPKHTGSITIPIAAPSATSGTITGSTTLSTAATSTQTPLVSQADSLTMGHIYANIHTAANPKGEIRANVVVK